MLCFNKKAVQSAALASVVTLDLTAPGVIVVGPSRRLTLGKGSPEIWQGSNLARVETRRAT